VALNFSGSSFLPMDDFFLFAGTNFCDYKRLVFLLGGIFAIFGKSRLIEIKTLSRFVFELQVKQYVEM